MASQWLGGVQWRIPRKLFVVATVATEPKAEYYRCENVTYRAAFPELPGRS